VEVCWILDGKLFKDLHSSNWFSFYKIIIKILGEGCSTYKIKALCIDMTVCLKDS
jgi:hypothetical protein